jgi:Tfp pilus assembly protein PilN
VIRNNLSTQPFYNEGAVRLWLTVLVGVVVLVTLANVSAVFRYLRSDTQLAAQASRDEERAAELRRTAAKLRASVDTKQIAAAATQAREANALIDRRTFSWTALLNRFEETLPDNVRITSVRPGPSRGKGVLLAITVVARDVDGVNRFIESLEATSAFSGVFSAQEAVNEDGDLDAAIEAVYQPRAAEATPR